VSAFGQGVRTARTRDELRAALAPLRAGGATLALVPTMGALHPGHLSLFDMAGRLADRVVASVFVNPLQFGADEDLDRYPTNLDADVRLAAARGVAVVFAPTVAAMYPEGASGVHVHPGRLGGRLCGPFRPGHFEGVLTIVAKLFGLVRPDLAIFGRKDLQQAVLIRRMVRDLELGVQVEVAPLVREPDGLAMSSRNAYLSPEERRDALGIHAALEAADGLYRKGVSDADALLGRAREVLGQYPVLRPEYAELVDPESLDSLEAAGTDSIVAVAVRCGSTRLIDNLVLGASHPDPRVPPAHG